MGALDYPSHALDKLLLSSALPDLCATRSLNTSRISARESSIGVDITLPRMNCLPWRAGWLPAEKMKDAANRGWGFELAPHEP